MKHITFILLLISGLSGSINAQTDGFSPNGKPIIRIFSNYHSTFSEGEHSKAFELKRVYLGYDHNFSENISGRVIFDVGNPGFGKLEMTAYVKNAYLRYRKDRLNIHFGMISTTQFKVQESAWGYRYLEKSFQDEYNFNASADIGVSAAYEITDFLHADVIIANGEGYKKVETDSTLRYGAGITVTPAAGLTLRAYYDFSSNMNAQQSVATFLGYENDRFSLGAEYMIQLQPDFISERQWTGLSFFGTLILSDRWQLFGRYDMLSSNTIANETENWNFEGDGSMIIAGLQYSPVRGIKLAPNFKGWNPADNSKSFVSTAILNVEVIF